jgi:hypothetical protein
MHFHVLPPVYIIPEYVVVSGCELAHAGAAQRPHRRQVGQAALGGGGLIRPKLATFLYALVECWIWEAMKD